jgi:hypothetical protein
VHRPLHVLRLAVPGTVRLRRILTGDQRSYMYVWPCGCKGAGTDPEAIEFTSCAEHHHLLDEAPITRVSGI